MEIYHPERAKLEYVGASMQLQHFNNLCRFKIHEHILNIPEQSSAKTAISRRCKVSRNVVLAALLFAFALSLVLAAFAGLRHESLAQTQREYDVEVAFLNSTFNQPVGITANMDGANRPFSS
jgi:hypothetical protein